MSRDTTSSTGSGEFSHRWTRRAVLGRLLLAVGIWAWGFVRAGGAVGDAAWNAPPTGLGAKALVVQGWMESAAYGALLAAQWRVFFLLRRSPAAPRWD